MCWTCASVTLLAVSLFAGSPGFPQAGAVSPDLTRIIDGQGWKVVGRKAASFQTEGRKGVHLDEGPGNGIAWLESQDFVDGTIEVDLKGRNVPQASFIGVAFRVVDGETHDAVYFRPFNFKSPNEVNRSHGVQYVSHPVYTWQKLRTEKPGVYENQVNPVPDPEGWFHARITVAGSRIQVFVNDASSPSLSVEALSERKSGRIGLWVGNGSDGWFANLKITPMR
jgi:hypothetical protein